MDESAPGANDGEAEVTISGGMPNYNVSWTGPVSGTITLNSDQTFVIIGLSGGVYTVTVVDATGCTTTCQFTIIITMPCTVVVDNVKPQTQLVPA